jgi:peptidoglycan/LPS O-acetylase OafA/YrhL
MPPAYSLHLDVVRGLAALLVFVGHLRLIITGHTGAAIVSSSPATIASHPGNATGLGHSSVIAFFVLSGYLVGGSVLRDLDRNRFSWHEYAIRRLSRLWTVLVPCLLVGGTLDYLTTRYFPGTHVVVSGTFTSALHGPPELSDVFRYLFFLQCIDRLSISPFGTNAALWSLSAEFWYYVLFPILAVALLSASRPRSLRIGLIGVAALLLWFLGQSIGQCFPLWLCGVAAYLTPITIPINLQKPVIAVLAVQLCFVLYLFRAHAVNALVADTAIAVSFTLLLYALCHRVGAANTSLYSRVAHALSFPSYTLYASHIPMCIFLAALCQARMPELFQHTYLVSALVFLLVLIYAGGLYFCFERNTEYVRRFVESCFLSRSVGSRGSVTASVPKA